MKTILLLGGDGYLGWPLAMKLALRYPDHKITLVDNFTRRRLSTEVHGHSLLPIPPLTQRLSTFQRVFQQNNLHAVELDVASPQLDALIETERPSLIYHLAQQASAAYSMRGPAEAVFTIRNNEEGNMRLLFSMRDHVPNTPLIKLGSFGEYCTTNLDVAEGYFYPEYKGVKADTPMPYPRGSDDIYHITKINDTNFIAMACRKWGLRITDIMQATVVGTATKETVRDPDLYTRFDYDSTFGTVLNRFLTQVLSGHPLTVYGSGKQRTGLMDLEDSLSSLLSMAEHPAGPGEHRVINHVTERRYSINELASELKAVVEPLGYPVEVSHAYDPRDEQVDEKKQYNIESRYVDEHVEKTPLDQVIRKTVEQLLPYKGQIDHTMFPPTVQWQKKS